MKNKKNIVFLSIGAITLIVAVLGATYAFFTAQGGGSGNTNLNVGSSTTDSLSFNAGSAINLNITQDNFSEGAGNQAGSTTASATLTANNATNSATAHYYLYLNILSNNLVYTTEEQTAELILTIKDPNGTPVTELSGYEYVTVGEVSGFDITTKDGLITLASNYEITSTGTQTQEWEVTVTFINLDTDQNDNTGKSFSANLIIQEDMIPTNLSDVCHDGGNMAECIIALYNAREEGENGLYYHDGSGSYTNADQEAGDNSYRFAGANPNNFVCFGSNDTTCSNDNLYRIIGVFDGQVKLIKYDYTTTEMTGSDGSYYKQYGPSSGNYKGSLDPYSTLAGYYWNSVVGQNIGAWSRSNLNTVNLNTNYINYLGSEWTDKIATTTWQVGGISSTIVKNNSVKTVYNYEIGNNLSNTTYNAKIGLIYISDYGYAAGPENWIINLGPYNESNKNNNWMYMGITEWTISRLSGGSTSAFKVSFYGYVDSSLVYSSWLGIRPAFYLNENVEFSSGSGTQSDPYRIV